jgi:hypothetical protein
MSRRMNQMKRAIRAHNKQMVLWAKATLETSPFVTRCLQFALEERDIVGGAKERKNMFTYFNAEVVDAPSFYKGGVILKVETLVRNKKIQYNVEISPSQLFADGFIDMLIDEFKRRIKEKLKEIAPQNVFEAGEQIGNNARVFICPKCGMDNSRVE